MNDVIQYENDFVIATKTRHQTPIVHTTSIMNIDEKATTARGHSRHTSLDANRLERLKRLSIKPMRPITTCDGSDTCLTDGEVQPCDSESSLSAGSLGSLFVVLVLKLEFVQCLSFFAARFIA